MAVEEDMLVILRPGPYICAERDFVSTHNLNMKLLFVKFLKISPFLTSVRISQLLKVKKLHSNYSDLIFFIGRITALVDAFIPKYQIANK